MAYMDEYNKLKKNRFASLLNSVAESPKKEDTKTDSPYLKEYKKAKEEEEAKRFKLIEEAKKTSNSKTTVTTSKEKEEEKERKWFNSGLFEDGYQFGDIAKSILGTGSDLLEDVGTGVIGIGETAVDAIASIAPVFAQSQYYQNGGMYQNPTLQKAQNDLYNQAKKETEEFVKKDLYDEQAVAKKLLSNLGSAAYMSNITQNGGFATQADLQMASNMQNASLKYLNDDMEKASVLGDKSDALVQSAGQLLATMGLQAAGVPWWLTTGVTSFGAETENALKQGATLEEANLSAAISAGAEILTEKLSGGISFGGKTLDDALTQRLARSISNKLVRNGLKVGMDFVGEGSEEVLSSVFSNLGSALYKEESIGELLTSEEAIDEYIESFIGGGVLGGVSSTGKAIMDTVSGKDYTSGLTNNEKAVVDKVYNDAIAKEEADGKKLTERRKTEIYNETLKALEKGYIDTDTIESVLGGDTYSTLKTITEQETASQKEYDNLYQMKNGEKSDAQVDRQAELKKYLEETATRKTQLREELDNALLGFVQDSKLSESYNEKNRRGQVFEADLTQYDAKQAEVVKKAVESGILNNTNRTHDFVDMIAKVSADKGVLFDFTNNQRLKESGFAVDGKAVNGFVKDNNVTLNIDSAKSLNSVVGHEITHVLEGTELYNELQNIAIEYAKTKGEYDTRLQALTKLYDGVEGANVDAELTADLVGDYLFTDSDFIGRLSTEHRNVFQKIYDEIKYLYKVATAGSKEARELEKVKKAFEKAYRETEVNSEAKEISDTDTKYSLREEAPPKETGIAYKVFFVKDGKLYPPMVANPDGADTPIGVWLNADVGTAAPDSKTGRPQVKAGGKGTQGGSGSLAFRPGWHLGDLPRASQFDRVNPETGKKELFPENFVWAEVEYAKDVDYQEEAMSYGYTDNGKFRHAYAGLPRLPENGYYRYRTNPKPDTVPWVITGAMKVNRLLSDAEVNSILEKNGVEPVHRQGGDVGLEKFGFTDNTKYSLSDSEGKQLTKEQQEYFKDSKVRDENGNLKVMYHGTPNGNFTVFRDGTYFTDNKEYADRYQSTSASSISSGKVASNPKTFATYLNIRKPFDLSDAEAKSIYINDYIKGGNAIGINPYLSDAEYEKITTIDWTEGEDLRDFLIDNGYDYDGLILDEGADGGYGDDVTYRGKSYVIFNPEQVKSVDNVNPTSDPDIRFSLSETVEETKYLMAVHNLHSNELLKQLEMGGIAYPSIAVTKPGDISHDEFGEITLILNKDSIDPKTSKYNKVYSADAYTPTFPKIDYEASEKVADAISKKINSLMDEIPSSYQGSLRHLTDYYNINYVLDSSRGEQGLIERYRDDIGMKELYLAEKGEVVPIEIKTSKTEMTPEQKEMYQFVVDNLGSEAVEKYKLTTGFSSPMAMRKKWLERYGEQLRETYAKYFAKELNISTEEARADIVDVQPEKYWIIEMRKAYDYFKTGGVTIKEETDFEATDAKINAKIADSDYEQWLSNLFRGIEGNSGLRNGKETFLPNGNRRNFSQLHDPVTLDNIVKAMRKENQTGQGAFGTGNIMGASTKQYKSIKEIKKNSGRLGIMEEAEHEKVKKHVFDTFDEIARRYAGSNDYVDARDTLAEAVSKNETRDGIARYLKQYDYVYRYDDSIVDDIIELRDYIRTLPTPYFEAKPQRAVGFDEVGVFVIPYDADAKLKQELLNRGYSIAEYDPKVDGDRKRVVNQFEQYKFSLSETDIAPSPYGSYNVFGKDIALEQDIAPEEEIAPTTEEIGPIAEVYAPLTEAEANERDDAQIDSKYFLNQMAPEPEAPIYNEDAIPESPFDDRDFEDVGSQKVKAYMYENPEVKPFFQEEARIMLTELDNSVKGERVVNANMLYESGGEFGVYGTKRQTSEAIAYLRDSKYNYTYDKIRDGLNAIIEDHGAENNAISKRIEFLLDERLREGYTDTIFTGEKIPPNQEYLNLLTEKQITEYNDEAWENFLRGLSQEDMQQYIGPEEEIAPPVQSEPEIALVREDLPLYEDASGQQSMFESEDAETKRVNDFLQKERAKVTEAYEQRKAELQGLIADQNAYRSNKALELYNELSNLTKGVKASEQLGYLLDYGYPWSEVKKALRNIWYHPGERVNANSIPESVAREMLDKEYENESYALDELETEYKKQLEEAEAKAKEMQTKEKLITRSALHGDIIDNIRNKFAAKGYDLDDVLNSAKNLSTFATVDNTPQRVLEKALGYKQGQILSDLTVNQVAQNETDGTKWLDSFTNRKNGLLAQISKQYNIKPGSKESAAAQMYAEGFYVDDKNNIIAYGDAELAKDFPNQKVQANIKGLANDTRIREVYDNTLAMINASRKRNAYPEIPRLDNYFLHFRAMEDTFSRLGLPFNPNDIRAKDLPTDLNGVTADLKPGQPYFASAMHRTGKRTSFDLLGGLERYLTSAKNQIYHIDDIQTLRALRNYIADAYGQAHGLENLDTLTEEEAQERIEEVYGSHLSTFAKILNEEANVIAGKTTLIDRGLEGVIGRRGITFLDTINRQVGSNMVGFNISSSITNFLPVAQTFAKTNKADFVKAFAQTVSNKVTSLFGRNDGFAEQSPVMIRRKGADRFYRTPWQKVGDAGYAFMGAVDGISTELIARTKYNELTRKGMDSQKAHYETDKWVSRMMGDRSLGQQPQLYNSKMLGIFTKFQLEVRNQLDAQFYDTIQEAKVSNEEIQNGLARNAKTAAKVTSAFVQLAVVQHLFGKAFESVAGYNPAFDIIGAILKAVGYDDDEESEDTVLDNLEQGFLELLGDLPYTSTFTGGRIPISSALPVEQFVTGKDDYGNEKSRWETIKESAPYYVLPTGFGQIKKTYQGLSMFDDDLPIAGSYTDSGNLRFPVEDTLKNRVQAGIFGQWASENARDYFDNKRSPLKEKQIEEFMEVDLPIRDYWEYREGLSGLSNLSEKADYINSLDLPIEKKNILINNQADRKEDIDLTEFDDYANFEEFDFAVKNPEKYEIAQKVGGYEAYKTYKESMKDMKLAEKVDYVASLDLTTAQKNALINGETDRKEPIDLTGYENYGSFEEFEFAKENPGKHSISKAVGGYETYKNHIDKLNDFRADKNADGESIPGSAKEKKTEYINSLPLDYGQKIILFRSLYDGKADKAEYNADIVDYLNSRDDITYEEMVTILEELDFKVYPDGTIEW